MLLKSLTTNFTLPAAGPIKAYLRLRGRVLGRQLRELGWWRLLLVGAFLLAFAGLLFTQLSLDPRGRWVLVEIKRERLRREVIAQASDDASCMHMLDASPPSFAPSRS